MSKITSFCVFGILLGATAIAPAGERGLFRFVRFDDAPAFAAPLPAPAPMPYEVGPPGQVVPHGHAMPVYPGGHVAYQAPRIRIKDPDHIHPCAVHKTIMVPNPCSDCCNRCDMVPVTICVPPCACEDYKCKRDGCYQKFDYGKFEVEVRVKRGYVEVDYDD